MSSFLRKHDNSLLNMLAAVFLAIVVAFAAYGTHAFIDAIGTAFTNPASTPPVASFNLTGAAALDLRNLMQH